MYMIYQHGWRAAIPTHGSYFLILLLPGLFWLLYIINETLRLDLAGKANSYSYSFDYFE